MYRVYGHNKFHGWERLDKHKITDLKEAQEIMRNLNPKEYYSAIIIDSEGGDHPVDRIDFSKECIIEYVDEVKTKVEVKAMTFKPSKMKEKEELRKLTEKYIDR